MTVPPSNNHLLVYQTTGFCQFVYKFSLSNEKCQQIPEISRLKTLIAYIENFLLTKELKNSSFCEIISQNCFYTLRQIIEVEKGHIIRFTYTIFPTKENTDAMLSTKNSEIIGVANYKPWYKKLKLFL